jgi:hypothetical protein
MAAPGKKAIIIATFPSWIEPTLNDLIKKQEAEVILLNDEDKPLPVFPNAYKDFPLAILGTEKKKKKACGAHEYTYRGKEEISANINKEIWKCRHCEKKL